MAAVLVEASRAKIAGRCQFAQADQCCDPAVEVIEISFVDLLFVASPAYVVGATWHGKITLDIGEQKEF